MNDGEIRLKVSIDDNEAKSSMSKFTSAGKTIGSAIVKGSAVAGAALTGLVISSVKSSGELEQQIGGTEAVFGQFANKVQEDSKKAYSTAGLSANEYMGTINKMGSLMQGSGISQEKSMNLSAQAMQRASDVASIMGIDVGSAMESIAGAAKGNFTMMDNLGVAMNATSIEAYALSKGINKSYDEMSKGEQVQFAMEMFLEKSAYATGNYAKENETFAGSFSTLKASFENFMSGAGDISPLIDSVVSFGSILVTKITEMTPLIMNGIIQLINAILPQMPILLQQLLPGVISGVIALIVGIINTLPTIISMLAGMLPTILQALITGLVTITNSLADMFPTLIPTIIDAVLGLIPILIDNLPLFIDAGIELIIGLATGLVDAIPKIIEKLPQIISSIIDGIIGAIPQILAAAPKLIVALAKGLINAIPTLVKNIPKIITSIVNGLGDGVSKIFDVGKNLIKGLWNGIKDVSKWLYDKISNFAGGVINKVKGIFGIKSPSKEFAIIGRYNIEGLEEGIENEAKNLNKTLDGTFGNTIDYVAKMGTGKYDYTLDGNMLNNKSIILNTTVEAKVNEGVLFEANSRIDYNKGLQTQFGGA